MTVDLTAATVHFPHQWELALRLLLAAALGGIIGLERDVSDHPAGLRTHLTLAMGACLFGLLSAYGFAGLLADRNSNNFQVDPTRVASQIVVGVGFLGGGAILKSDAGVRGLSTAASWWTTAALGLGCALGAYTITLEAAGLLLLSLTVLRRPQRWVVRRLARVRETVVVRMTPDADPSAVIDALNRLDGVTVRSLVVRERGDQCVVQAELHTAHGEKLGDALAPLTARDDVLEVEIS